VSASLPVAVDTGVFVLGMHRSGTSAITRLVGLLGLATPPDEDLVQPTDKNPKGYWESEALVNFSERVLAAVDCHMSCPIRLEPGWQRDERLRELRLAAPAAVASIFPKPPWVWKDPRHCLTFSFWRDVVPVRPLVVLVNRNPLEIAASAQKLRRDQGKIYTLALWERYLRQGLAQIEGLPVLVADYVDALRAPIEWCEQARVFLTDQDVPASAPPVEEVQEFIDTGLRHNAFSLSDLAADPDVSSAQRALFESLDGMRGAHERFSPPQLPPETPTTEALLDERRQALRVRREAAVALEHRRWSSRIGRRVRRVLDRR
jgi:hypothetical protein